MASLEPFWLLPPNELRARIAAALDDVPGIVSLVVKNGTVETSWWPKEMQDYVSVAADLVPDMSIAVNTMDEPRVTVADDSLQYLGGPPRSGTVSNRSEGGLLNFLDLHHQDTWSHIARSCPLHSINHSSTEADIHYQELQFVNNPSMHMNICAHPEFRKQHGLFSSPESFRPTTSMVPIFSQGRPTIFSDLLYPSPYYISTLDDYHTENDRPYRDKESKLYWAGSTTGGHFTPNTWQTILRTRFAALVADRDSYQRVVILSDQLKPAISTAVGKNRQTNSHWATYHTSMATFKELFQVKITGIIQCDDEGQSDWCSSQSLTQHFDVGGGDPPEEALKYKLVMDLDGNGFSGRFYRLLKSNSCVFKSTIYREWHDDWLIPWVHFVPISIGLEELTETVRFMSTDERGQAVGEAIARQGQTWANKSLRKIDMALVMVRTLLEMGRLLDDRRDQLGFDSR